MFSGRVFAPKIARGKQSRFRTWQDKDTQLEYRNVWLIIHYPDFDFVSVTPYDVFSLQLEI